MLYVANVTTFSVILELLCKFTVLIRYKLNILQPTWVNHFDIHALLFGGYTRLIQLDKMFYIDNGKHYPLAVH